MATITVTYDDGIDAESKEDKVAAFQAHWTGRTETTKRGNRNHLIVTTAKGR